MWFPVPLTPPSGCLIDKLPTIHFKEKINQLPPLHLAFSAHTLEILTLEKELGVVFFPRQEHGPQSLTGV